MAQVQQQVAKLEEDRWSSITRHVDETTRTLQATAIAIERINGQLLDHDRRIRDIEASPARMRDWLSTILIGMSAIGSGFGCAGCLSSVVTVIGAVLSLVIWIATHH